jgi:hypothetical protein
MALKIFFLHSLQLPQYPAYLHLLFVKFTGKSFLKVYSDYHYHDFQSAINSMDWERIIRARKPPQYFEFGPASQDPFSFCQIQLALNTVYCKRPIQCLASSKILTPHPLTARRVCTPMEEHGATVRM